MLYVSFYLDAINSEERDVGVVSMCILFLCLLLLEKLKECCSGDSRRGKKRKEQLNEMEVIPAK